MLVHFLSRAGRDRAPEARFLGLWAREGREEERKRGRERRTKVWQ